MIRHANDELQCLSLRCRAVALAPVPLACDVRLGEASECSKRNLHSNAHLPAPMAWLGVAQRGGVLVTSGRAGTTMGDKAKELRS